MPFSRLLNTLLMPLVLVTAALWIIYHPELIPLNLKAILNYLPLVLSLIVIGLGWQFNLYRLSSLTLLFSLVYVFDWFLGGFDKAHILQIKTWLIWQVPLTVMLISWYPERGIFSRHGLLFSLITLVFLGLGYYLNDIPQIQSLQTHSSAYLMPLTWFSAILLLLAIIHQGFRLWRFDNVLDGTLIGILLMLGWQAVQSESSEMTTVLIHILIQLQLCWALIKHSHDMAYRDELTGLPGRRALNELLKAPGRKYVIAMMDIDHFKKFNDRYGHDVGDDVLKIVASKLARVTGGGKAYRYGGEEFTIVFKGKELPLCIPHLEAVREDIGHYKISLRELQKRPKSKTQGKQQRGRGAGGKKISVTISIGVARKTSDRTAEEVIKAADQLLYKAKKAGRNCLVADK